MVLAVSTAMTVTMMSCGSSRSAMRASETGRVTTPKGQTASTGGGKNTGGSNAKTPATPPVRIDFSSIALTPSLERLLKEADSWIGTPYLYGGNDRNGVDCSGFVCQVFRNSIGVGLPRTSRDQHKYCRSIERETLEPGDLVFFTLRGGSTVGHVGIYIGNDQMIHASSSKGVVISSLLSNYYVVNYYGSGRVDSFYAMKSAEKKEPATKKATSKPKPGQPVQKPMAPKPEVKPEVKPQDMPPAVSPQVLPEVEFAETEVGTPSEPDRKEISRTIASRVSRIGHFATGGANANQETPADEPTDIFD